MIRMNTAVFSESLGRDVRYGSRMLRRNPGFTAAVLLTLAIGIGSNTAVFSVLNSILLKPLSYPEPDRLVYVTHNAPGAAGLSSVSGDLLLSPSMYVTYAEHNRTFQSMGIWNSGTATITGAGQPEQVRATFVTGGALQALAVKPLAGRWITGADEQPGSPAVILLNYGYWQRRFGGDRSVVGRIVNVDSRPREIAGIMPRDFRLAGDDSDIMAPVTVDRADLRLPGFGFRAVARLKPGVTLAEANADIGRLVPVWMHSWPASPGINPNIYESWRISPAVRPLRDEITGSIGSVLWLVMGTIGIVMLIVCANVANLLLVRAQARERELAVRAALGAGRGRILRELMVESLLLAVTGGGLGLALAEAGLRLLRAIGPGNLPRLNEISLDGGAVGFAVAVTILSGLGFGLLPALKYAGRRIAIDLRAGGRSASDSRERHQTRNILVVAQVAMALVLLISAGLMIRTFLALRQVQPGFVDPETIQTLRTEIPESLVPNREQVIRIQNNISDRIRAIPGVTSVAFASEMPMDGIAGFWDGIRVEGQPIGNEIPPMRVYTYVSPGLFRTMGTRLIAGRDYTWEDIYGRRPEAIVSENLARELWGSAGAAIGKRIATLLPSAPLEEVIGVVQDVRSDGVQKPAPAIVYWPSYRDNSYAGPGKPQVTRTVTYAIRTKRAGSASLLGQLNQAVWSVNSSLPLASVRTMRDIYDQSLARVSFTLVMLAIASAMALALGIIGIYGVISYSVSQRRREIGIRVALGAQQGTVKRSFVGYGLVLAGIGAVIGLGIAAALSRLMGSVLFGISPLDPLTYLAMPAILAAAAALASYLPARRAAMVDPMEALRAE